MPHSSAIDMESSEGVTDPATYVSFVLSGQRYALSVGSVREILDLPSMARLPGASSSVLGVIDVRGETVPIVDLARRLGVEAACTENGARILVLEAGQKSDSPDHSHAVGVIADRVLGVIEIDEHRTEPAPPEARRAGLVRRVARLDNEVAFILNVGPAVFDQGQ
jgi:purine-binding chemotaxis protein CheW